MLDKPQESWPLVNYTEELADRQGRLIKMRRDPSLVIGARHYYKNDCYGFIRHWGVLQETRDAFDANALTLFPFVPFDRQRDLILFICALLKNNVPGLIEKSRDMGATWIAVWIAIWLWLFYPNASIGFGSQKKESVDRLGDPSSIFEKIRIGLRNLPREFLPAGFSEKCMPEMRILNPENGSVIIGGVGDNIGRGGRTLVTFKDESAWYEHPEMIEAALSQNTNVQIDISSVHGLGTVFHRRRESGIEWFPGKKMVKGRVQLFIMDWRSHPKKTQTWYDLERSDYERRGMLHVWAQEVDRDYAASVEGVIIPALWVKSAIDAHKKLGLKCDGGYCAGLDIADEGGDRNALVARRGVVVTHAEEWGEMDTGKSARKAVDLCTNMGNLTLQYDCIGVGAGAKAEFNRLSEENLIPNKHLRFAPWNAGAEVQDKEKHSIPHDRTSPLNEDLFQNLKAQAWWSLRHRFELTHRAVTDPTFTWEEDDLVSIPSELPYRYQLEKELSQPTIKQSSRMRMLVDKKPDGARSPNMADAMVMCYFPVQAHVPMEFSPALMTKLKRMQQRKQMGMR
jgi:hypothetical protein